MNDVVDDGQDDRGGDRRDPAEPIATGGARRSSTRRRRRAPARRASAADGTPRRRRPAIGRGTPSVRIAARVRSRRSAGGISRTTARMSVAARCEADELVGARRAAGEVRGDGLGRRPYRPPSAGRARRARAPRAPAVRASRRDPSCPYRSSPAGTGIHIESGAGPELGSESPPQAQERPPRPCLDRAERPAEPIGDLGLRQVLLVRQQDDRPFDVRHRREGGADRLPDAGRCERPPRVPASASRRRRSIRPDDEPLERLRRVLVRAPPPTTGRRATAGVPRRGADRSSGCGRSHAARRPASRPPGRTSRPGSRARGMSPARPPRRSPDPTSAGRRRRRSTSHIGHRGSRGPPRTPPPSGGRRRRRRSTPSRPFITGLRPMAGPSVSSCHASADRCVADAASEPAGRWASRQVTPAGPTTASWRVPAGSSSRSPVASSIERARPGARTGSSRARRR